MSLRARSKVVRTSHPGESIWREEHYKNYNGLTNIQPTHLEVMEDWFAFLRTSSIEADFEIAPLEQQQTIR
jgi:hypothetical protein